MKKKWLKRIFYFTVTIFLIIAAVITYVLVALPDVGPAPDMKIAGTAAQVDRGKYLATNVMICMECHSQRDWSLFAAPAKPGTQAVGGEVHDQRLGFPGKYVSGNITSAALGNWTDGEIFRAITSGVNKNGKALFPIMPYSNFGQLDEEDIKSVIAFLRTLKPVEYVTEKSSSDFPMNIIINTIPEKANLKPMPNPADSIAYGKYLVTAASCGFCHTKSKDGKVTGPEFAGDNFFTLADGSVVRSANLTPHTTGIGNWTSEQFVNRFKMYTDSSYQPAKVSPGDFQTVMPWSTYAGMDERDLRAIYAYLKTIPAQENLVEKFTSVQK